MRKHTPGPWEILQSDGFLQIASCSDIAKGISFVYARNGVAAMYANAQLIAAAPELLKAAMDLFADASDRGEIFDADETMHDDWAALKKAIDKALGVAS